VVRIHPPQPLPKFAIWSKNATEDTIQAENDILKYVK